MGSDEGRGWKRQKSSDEEDDVGVVLSVEKVSALRESLKDVCSLDDLRARMEEYMSKKGCNEVLSVMSRLCKVRICSFVLACLAFCLGLIANRPL